MHKIPGNTESLTSFTQLVKNKSLRPLWPLKQSAGLLANAQRALETLGPQATLNRGYAIVQQQDGSIVRDAAKLKPDETIKTRFARGSIESKVKKINEEK